MENEDNLPVQCHPIIKPKKRIKPDIQQYDITDPTRQN